MAVAQVAADEPAIDATTTAMTRPRLSRKQRSRSGQQDPPSQWARARLAPFPDLELVLSGLVKHCLPHIRCVVQPGKFL